MSEPHIIPIEEAVKSDLLHRGDLVFVRWDPEARGWAQRLIVDHQANREKLTFPECEMQHVMVVTHRDGGNVSGAAQEWRGWSLQPWRGREVHIPTEYHACQLWIMRFEGWEDDAARYEYCDRVIAECKHFYSFSGCIKTALGGWFPQIPGGRFCSQSAETPAEDLGIDGGQGFVRDYKGDRVSPGRLASSPLLSLVAVVYSK